jgi:AcrR family transcriptional regulator
MSGIKARRQDRRVERTRQSLREALLALMVEKGYEALTVQDILDRANVGRSTFYTHFRDKDELLVSGLDLLRAGLAEVQANARKNAKGLESALAFTLPLFEHVHSHRHLHKVIAGRQSGAMVHREFLKIFASLARQELTSLTPRTPQGKATLELTIAFLSASLYGVMAEWLDHHPRLTPQEVNETFRRLVMPGVRTVLG